MTKTFKIFSIISFIAMAIVLTFVGVWAITDLDFSVGGDITYTAPKPTINLQQDDKGFYVTMGHTDTVSEIKWRLVGLDGNKFNGSTKPTSGKGTFILETLIDYKALGYVFDETNYSNDYAGSDIRRYLNGDYITTLNLANDATYNAIAERSVADMYKDIGWNLYQGNSSYAENAVYSITTTNTESDKLWLMSVAEVYTLLGGGAISPDGIISDDWSSVRAGCNWDAKSISDDYWLRSPASYDSLSAFYVYSTGAWSYNDVDGPCAVRPAFNFEF